MSEEENPKFDDLFKELFEQAFSDGVITDEEYELIQQVELDVDNLNLALTKALEDGVITAQENAELNELKAKLLDQANKKALSDGIVDEDEQGILSKLSELIGKYIPNK